MYYHIFVKKLNVEMCNVFSTSISYLIGDCSCIVINGENWEWNFGLGVVRTVTVVIVTLLKEGVVSGLEQIEREAEELNHSLALLPHDSLISQSQGISLSVPLHCVRIGACKPT